MKHSFLILTLFVSIVSSSASFCDKNNDDTIPDTNIGNNTNDGNMASNKISVKVNSKTFTATLLDNSSAKAFKEILPMTINMIELNGNEKYYDLSKSLPTNSSNPGIIKKGDLMLYGSTTLVLFYKVFSTSYSYTKLGTINDATGLALALGSGNVTITFEIDQ